MCVCTCVFVYVCVRECAFAQLPVGMQMYTTIRASMSFLCASMPPASHSSRCGASHVLRILLSLHSQVPKVNPQHRLLAIGTKEFPMDYLLLKKSDSTYLFCARASACALAGVLPFTLPLTFACALPRNAPAMHLVRAVFDMTALDRPTYAACLGGCDGCLQECTTLS